MNATTEMPQRRVNGLGRDTGNEVPMLDHPTLPFVLDEIWRPVLGWEDRYEVSDQGRVRPIGPVRGRAIQGDVLSTQPDSKGYVYVHLWRDHRRSRRPVHQLVAEAFLGAGPPGMLPDHLDSDPSNNRSANLEWVTFAVNTKRAYERGDIKHTADCSCVVCTRTRNKLNPVERRARNAVLAREGRQRRVSQDYMCFCGAGFGSEKARSVHRSRMHPWGATSPGGYSTSQTPEAAPVGRSVGTKMVGKGG